MFEEALKQITVTISGVSGYNITGTPTLTLHRDTTSGGNQPPPPPPGNITNNRDRDSDSNGGITGRIASVIAPRPQEQWLTAAEIARLTTKTGSTLNCPGKRESEFTTTGIPMFL